MNLKVAGFSGRRFEPRRQPDVQSACVTDGAHVYFPPLDLREGKLVAWEDRVSADRFKQLEGEGAVTSTFPWQVQEDHCLFFPEGNAPVEYLSMAEAATRLRDFHDEQIVLGDKARGAGYVGAALRHYERAAAAGQTPEAYGRMLSVPMPEDRRLRIEALKEKAERSAEHG